MSHECHISHCNIETKPELLFCIDHWNMVPNNMKDLVYKYYTPGQCNDLKKIKREWVKVAQNAHIYVRWLSTGSTEEEALAKIPYPEENK